MTTPPVAFGGWYRENHAYTGLRLQLVPFAAFTLLLLTAVAVLLVMESLLLALLLFALAAAFVAFLVASYRANTVRIRSTFRQQHCQGELRETGLWLGGAPEAPEVPWSQFTNLQVFAPMMLLHAANGDVTMLPREFFVKAEWPVAVALVRASVQRRGAIPRQLKIALVAFFLVALLAVVLFLAAR